LECKIYPFNTLGQYKYADIIARYDGKWIFSKHKARDTWETQGGHIEGGETPTDTAKREHFEEAGAIDFDPAPLCDYSVRGQFNGKDISGNGRAYLAEVRKLGNLPPESEMQQICLLDTLPENLTYPELIRNLFRAAEKHLESEATV